MVLFSILNVDGNGVSVPLFANYRLENLPGLLFYLFKNIFIQGRLVSNGLLFCPSTVKAYSVKYEKIHQDMATVHINLIC